MQPKYSPRLHRVRGLYYVRYYDPQRGRKSVALHTRSPALAESLLAEATHKYLWADHDPWSSSKEPKTVGHLVRDYLLQKKRLLKKRSYDSVREVVSRVDSLDYKALMEVVLRGDPAPQTIKRRMTSIKGFLRWCEEGGHTGCPRFSREKSPRIYQNEPRWVRREHFDHLIKRMRAEEPRLWLINLSLLGASTGGRLSSILSLEWSDVDEQSVTFRTTKTRSYSVPRNPMSDEVLNARGSGLVLGKRITKDTASRAFSKWRDAMGWAKPYSFHVLRHTYASWLVQAGVDLYTVSKWMGHSSIKVTEKYAHLAPYHNATIARRVFAPQ